MAGTQDPGQSGRCGKGASSGTYRPSYPRSALPALTSLLLFSPVRVSKPRVSEPGEVRKEYEEQISKHVEERRALEEAEQKASEEYIQRLLAEEEERLGEERKRQAEKQLEDDARLARLLSQELNSSPVLEAHRSGKPADNSLEKKKKPVAGDIERSVPPHHLHQMLAPVSRMDFLALQIRIASDNALCIASFSMGCLPEECLSLNYDLCTL
ncbi:E3 ubiquitin-protein ligase rnf168-like [Denticeps clupeoides]|uniref:E3 ubiquitin-protein ligase rnf168-like n=1 Tax=Denticeps clupeoides TaxID=299321 RepID=UPI0010A3E47C|nr:E3 ubiquitin-protein ligase rnf168-like [Denticeps clupeoides]